MLTTLLLCFVGLLFLGMPISILLALTTAVALMAFTSTPLTILAQQLFNALDNFVLLAIPFFILAGGLMTEGAIARRLIAVMNLLVGRFRGGSAMATVVAIGSIMYPALMKQGYSQKFATGLVTTAGSLGIVIPPSIPMILYCLVMNVSVAKLFMAGVVPGLLIGAALMVYTAVLSRRYGWRSQRAYSRKEALVILKEGVWALLLPVIVLGGIYSGVFTPTEAAAVSVVYALLVEFLIYKELTLAKLFKVCRDSAMLSACLLFILACAMTFVWLLTAEQLPGLVADHIMQVVDSWWMFMILVTAFFLVTGAVMDAVSAMIVLSPLFIETLARFNIDLIHYGIFMVLMIEFGFLTPPFGLNLFVSMGMSGQSLTRVAAAVAPFLVVLFACIMLITFVPQISLFLPNLLLGNLK